MGCNPIWSRQVYRERSVGVNVPSHPSGSPSFLFTLLVTERPLDHSRFPLRAVDVDLEAALVADFALGMLVSTREFRKN